MPWYNGEEATKYLKEAIGEYYQRSEKPVFQALWENYNFCQFVDDEGERVDFRGVLNAELIVCVQGTWFSTGTRRARLSWSTTSSCDQVDGVDVLC